MAVTKRSPIQHIRGIGGMVAGLVLMSGAGQAADFGRPTPVVKAPVVVGPAFTFTTSAYLWATGLEGRLRTLPPFPAANVNIGFDQVMKNFDGGLMGTAEMRYGRYIGFFDFMASKISPGKAINPAGYPGSVKTVSGSFTGMAAAGYRWVDDPRYAVDGFAGIRGFAMRNSLKVQVVPVALKLTNSEQWIDAVVGGRLKVNFAPSWHSVLMGFVGTGGSRYMWDVYGGIGYDFNKSWSAFAGYRAMKVDYRRGSFVYDAYQHGPLLGIQSHF